MQLSSLSIDTPLGIILAQATEKHLFRLCFEDSLHEVEYEDRNIENPILLQTKKELSEYFAGTRKEF